MFKYEYCWNYFLDNNISIINIKNDNICNISRIYGSSSCNTLIVKSDIEYFKPFNFKLFYSNEYLCYPTFIKTENNILLRVKTQSMIVPSESEIFSKNEYYIIKYNNKYYYFDGELQEFNISDFIKMNPYNDNNMLHNK